MPPRPPRPPPRPPRPPPPPPLLLPAAPEVCVPARGSAVAFHRTSPPSGREPPSALSSMTLSGGKEMPGAHVSAIKCNQVQSSAIECNQVQSSAIKCNQVQSSALSNHLSGEAERPSASSSAERMLAWRAW
jgi:hypothetical protein